MILRQNIHMGIFNGAAMKEAVGKAKALEFEKKKKNCMKHWREQRGVGSYLQWQIGQSDGEISSNCGKNYYYHDQ
mgnify:CR=1 FL=1